MTPYIPIPDPITPAWLTEVLRGSGALAHGQVHTVASAPTSAFNSATSQLQLGYTADAAPELPARLILKRNLLEDWAIEAAVEETRFYQLIDRLDPRPPAIVPCYAAACDPVSGNSYLLLRDLSTTHAPPVARDQQVSIARAVPPADAIMMTIGALAEHHAYWWNHSLFATDTFPVGYWSRDAERFGLYLQRRRDAWDSLIGQEASWLPDDIRQLYTQVLDHLERHWARYLEPRFRTRTHLTLVHGDAYFANVLCPTGPADDRTYLIDWQSPTVDIGGYDLANLIATFWTSEQRHEAQREAQILAQYHRALQAHGVNDYTQADLHADYQAGLIYWLLVPIQDRHGGAPKEYWWPKMQCLVAAFREWQCAALLGIADAKGT